MSLKCSSLSWMKCFEPETEVCVGSKQLGCGAPRYIHAHTHMPHTQQRSEQLSSGYIWAITFTSSWCWLWSCPCSCSTPALFLKAQVTPSSKGLGWWTLVTFSLPSFFSCCSLANLSQASNTYNRNNESSNYYTDRFQARDFPCRQQHSPFPWIGTGRATATAEHCHNDKEREIEVTWGQTGKNVCIFKSAKKF